MIINAVRKIHVHDIENYSWRRLSQFQNIDFTTKTISELHKLDKKHLANARKQAEHIKFCLTQAKEYFEASKVVSLATKPVLQYYCIMSLALAEILIKQTADSRLSNLRANHNCHGLSFLLSTELNSNDSLRESASKMYAKPQTGPNGQPKGTFEVWRRSAREYPLAGDFIELHESAKTTTFKTLFTPENVQPPPLPSQGINLYQCLVNLPYMGDTLSIWHEQLQMVRAKVSSQLNHKEKQVTTSIVIHPTSNHLIDKFGNLCKFNPAFVNVIETIELPFTPTRSSLIIRWNETDIPATLPHSTCINSEDAYFTCSSNNLGEFGYLYLSLHILGNFARYYPDH